MAYYSTDSDSDERGSKTSKSGRKYRSSSESDDYRRKQRRKSRSISKERSNKSRSKKYESNRDSRSKLNKRGRDSRRSTSREKSWNSRRRSKSRERHRDRERRRSKSKDRRRKSKERSSKRNYRSSSSSSDSSYEDKSKRKEYKKRSPSVEEVKISLKNDDLKTSTVKPETLDEINSSSFTQKQFVSSKGKKLENIVIDLTKQTIKVPEVDQAVQPDTIFHQNLFLNEEVRMEKWVKELFSFRQKVLNQEMQN